MDFCLAELKSIITLYGFNLREIIEPEYKRFGKEVPELDHLINMESIENFPYLVMDWPQKLIEKLPEILERSVSIKRVVKIYGQGATYEEVIASINPDEFKPEQVSTETYAFQVGASGKKLK